MRCIYCLKDSSKSKQNAHIVPEAIIANDTTLPMGVECDNCNQYAGTKLEPSLIHHHRIYSIILKYDIPGKKKKVRKKLGRISKEDNKFKIIQNDVSSLVFKHDSVRVNIDDPPQYNELKFRRGLYHMVLNYFALKKGSEVVLRSEYNSVRTYIRFAKKGESWPYAQVENTNDAINMNLEISLIEDAPGQVVRFASFLDEFYVDLLPHSEIHEWAANKLPKGVLLK